MWCLSSVVEDCDYSKSLYVFSDTDMKCFKCRQTGHLACVCPEAKGDTGVSEQPGQDAARPAVVIPPAAAP